MRRTITSLFLILTLSGFAQSYAPFYSTSNGFFEENNGVGSSEPIKKASIDSSKVFGLDSIFYPFRNMGNTQNASSTINPCYNLYINSWMGSRIVVGRDSTIFYNNSNEPIYINQAAELGDSAVMHDNGGFVYLESKMVDKVYQNIPGIGFDSIKLFIITAKNSIGRPLSSGWEDDTLRLSKSNGLLNSYRWNIFPSVFHFIQPKVDANYLRIDEIYDFNVGDIFHYEGENAGIKNFRNVTISNKWFSSTLDSIYYERQVAEEFRDPNGRIINFYTDTIFYTDLDSLLNSELTPNRPNRLSANSITVFLMSRNEYNKRQFEEVEVFDHQVTIDSNCYSPQTIPQIKSNRFIKGAGRSFSIINSTNTIKDSLIYFKKGIETWGNPRLITGFNETSLLDRELSVFPNPSENFVTIIASSKLKQLEIFTVNGQLVDRLQLNDKKITIELPQTNGIYFIQALNEKGKYFQSKLVKN